MISDMIDDRQLLRLSRNNAAILLFVGGTVVLALALTDLGWHIEMTATAYFVPGSGPATLGAIFDWPLLILLGQTIAGLFMMCRRNWLARKLIKPVRADTCPGCDYPIDKSAAKCPECGLKIADGDSP